VIEQLAALVHDAAGMIARLRGVPDPEAALVGVGVNVVGRAKLIGDNLLRFAETYAPPRVDF
jgi:hypothetical protein